MRKGGGAPIGSVWLAIIAIGVLSIATASPVSSHGSFSGNQQYGAASCHGTDSTVSVTIESSPANGITLQTNQTISIWVNVTGTIGGDAMGVLIASNTAEQGSLPTENGWSILSDPSGMATTYNYYKMPSYAGSGSFKWTLKAPSSSGTYPIYALALHADSNEYHKAAGPVSFIVTIQSADHPSLSISAPTAGSTLKGIFNVNVEIIPTTGGHIVSATLRLDGATIGTKTSAPFSWSIDTSSYPDGAHKINITALDSGGETTWQEIIVTFNNAGSAAILNNLVWTIIAGSLAIVAICATLITVALMIGRKEKGGR